MWSVLPPRPAVCKYLGSRGQGVGLPEPQQGKRHSRTVGAMGASKPVSREPRTLRAAGSPGTTGPTLVPALSRRSSSPASSPRSDTCGDDRRCVRASGIRFMPRYWTNLRAHWQEGKGRIRIGSRSIGCVVHRAAQAHASYVHTNMLRLQHDDEIWYNGSALHLPREYNAEETTK